jgi:hypothetical protein
MVSSLISQILLFLSLQGEHLRPTLVCIYTSTVALQSQYIYLQSSSDLRPLKRGLNRAKQAKFQHIIMTTSSAGGFLCGYKPVVLAGSKEPLKIRHAHSYHRQALKGFSLCLVYWLTRKRVYVLFQ